MLEVAECFRVELGDISTFPPTNAASLCCLVWRERERAARLPRVTLLLLRTASGSTMVKHCQQCWQNLNLDFNIVYLHS